MKRELLLTIMMVSSAGLLHADSIPPPEKIIRAVAALNGVFSPRGFFNIKVRLYELPGLEWAKFDLKKSQLTLDFAPGVTVTEKDIQQVMMSAGYRAGAVTIELLPRDKVSENGSGWVRIKHSRSKNPLARWLEENF